MANLIQIKRSTTNAAPAAGGLRTGELAYSLLNSSNSLFVGDTSNNAIRVGGGNYLWLHQSNTSVPGTLTANAWNDLEIQDDTALNACRGRINSGTWSDWKTYTEASMYGIYIYSAGQDYYDNISISDVAWDEIPVISITEPAFTGPWTNPLHVSGTMSGADLLEITYGTSSVGTQTPLYSEHFVYGPYAWNFYAPLPAGDWTLTFTATGPTATTQAFRDVDLSGQEPYSFNPVATSTVPAFDFDHLQQNCDDKYPDDSSYFTIGDDLGRVFCSLAQMLFTPSEESVNKITSIPAYVGTKFPFTYVQDTFILIDELTSGTTTAPTLGVPIYVSPTATATVPLLSPTIVSTYPWVAVIRTWIGYSVYMAFGLYAIKFASRLL